MINRRLEEVWDKEIDGIGQALQVVFDADELDRIAEQIRKERIDSMFEPEVFEVENASARSPE